MDMSVKDSNQVGGSIVTRSGERYYAISHVDKIPPFFISLVSDNDHWLFASSLGGLTAGRVSPDSALFPYVTADKIYDSNVNTGSKTLLRVDRHNRQIIWEPFNIEHGGLYDIDRNIYKSLLGNKLCFEEVNHDLELVFRYSWMMSAEYGFIRHSELENLSNKSAKVEIVDGLRQRRCGS